jgi:hypothetical protein
MSCCPVAAFFLGPRYDARSWPTLEPLIQECISRGDVTTEQAHQLNYHCDLMLHGERFDGEHYFENGAWTLERKGKQRSKEERREQVHAGQNTVTDVFAPGEGNLASQSKKLSVSRPDDPRSWSSKDSRIRQRKLCVQAAR